jgi:twitching motility protein PilT
MPTSEDILFGKIALKNGLVDEVRLKECLALVDRLANGKGLGQVLVEKGYLSARNFQAISGHVRSLADRAAAGGKPEALRGEGVGAAEPAQHKTHHSAPQKEDFQRSPRTTPVVHARQVASRDYSTLVGQPLDAYLVEARALGASDLHFQVDSPPFLRLHGEIVYLKHPKLEPDYTRPRILEILDDHGREVFAQRNDYDFCYVAEHGRYRANFCRQRKGLDAVFRVIPERVPTLDDLHLPDTLRKFTKYRHGIVLITGPAGSGKTATMAALVDIVNVEQHDHIVMVEDPIEYVVESKNCNVNQRHVKVHTETFATALRSAMRADPDYICVGEMRDLETVSMAITAAETGHLVLATLHTTNAVRSVDRIIDVFPPKEQEQIRAMVSESLRGVISQKLLPRADGFGREPALEIMFATPAVANMVRERKTFQLASVLQTGAREGMVTMDDSIQELLQKKIVTRETAHYHAENKERFRT